MDTVSGLEPICLKDIFLIFLDENTRKEMKNDAEKNKSSNNRRFSKIDIYKRNGITSAPKFAQKILPMDFFLVLTKSISAQVVSGSTEDELSALLIHKNNSVRSSTTTLNRVFNNDLPALSRFQEAAILLTRKSAAGYTAYDNCPYRLELVSRWASVLNGISGKEEKTLNDNISILINRFNDNKPWTVKSRLQAAEKSSAAEVLASLTLIACTPYIWNGSSLTGEDQMIPDIVLPPLPGKGFTLPSQDILKKNADTAQKKLDEIREEMPFFNQNHSAVENCYAKCLGILDIKPLGDAKILGETYYILFKCCQQPRFLSPDGVSADFYLRQSQKFEYEEALSVSPQDLSLYELPPRGTSNKTGIGIFNESNQYSEIFADSLPVGWTPQLFDGTEFCSDISKACKYLLCSEKESKNIADLLKILDFYKRTWNDLLDVEVFILGKEEVLAGIIDTAQKYMETRVIHIHIINIDQLSAQYLLARHPLFFPIIDYPAEPADLNFVIIGTDRCAEYLVRTAFWMMTFTDNVVTPKITVIGQNASGFVSRIQHECPGLGANIVKDYPVLKNYSFNIASVDIPDFYSEEFDRKFEELMKSNTYLYFAISSEDDMKNLELATDLREKMIRHYIDTRRGWLLKNPPPIAFRCTDFNIACMSRKLVVNTINHGTAWYNNQAIFPFGCYATDIFNWDSLVENPVEHLAKSSALVYRKTKIPVDPGEFTAETIKKLDAALQDYYGSQYNKSSSFAVALSIPYRLFNCIIRGNRIIPETWDIANRDAYYNYTVLSYFAQRLNSGSLADVIEPCGIWEHERWIRWCLSEKWLPSSIDDIHFYQKEGAPKHQLHIARLHPCIRSWEELPALEKDRNKDFHSFDLNSIKMTRDILRGAVAWHASEIREPEREREKENER